MKKLFYPIALILIILFAAPAAHSQVLVSDNATATADPSAMLDVQSTSKGFLFPRMNETQRDNISNPPTGLVIFQTSATSGFYYNKGLPASPSWERLKESSEIGGLWSPGVGSDIYYTGGNVGIGNASPTAALDVDGDIYVSGSPGMVSINATTGNEPVLHFEYEGSSMFNLNIDAPASSPYLSVSTDSYSDVWGVNTNGRVWHSYQGSVQAYVLLADAESSAMFIENASNTDDSRGINAVVSDASATETETLAVGGWDLGLGSGLYGENDQYSNFGHVGTVDHGVYGEFRLNLTDGNRGNLGNAYSGAYGEAGLTGHYGRLGYDASAGFHDWGVFGVDGGTNAYWGGIGTNDCAVYGSLGGTSQNLANGDFAFVGHGVWNSGASGSGYFASQAIGGVMGYNNVGVQYGFGVAGYTSTANNQTGGVLGYLNSNNWGSLGYRTSGGTNYGVYASGGTGSGGGKAQLGLIADIGMGAYGDLFGAHVDGAVYGLYAKGENYGIYADGDMYRTGADVHLQKDNNGQNNVMYTLVSPEMTVQTYGIGQLQNGKASIVFDDAFANIVSSSEPIIITITPIGKSEAVYLDEVDVDGFAVRENNSGKSNVQFSWIAIGKRAGFENKSLPQDVIAADYNDKIERGLSRDADPNDQGEGLYYQNGTLHTGQLAEPRINTNEGEAVQLKELEPSEIESKTSSRMSEIGHEKAPKGKTAEDKIK